MWKWKTNGINFVFFSWWNRVCTKFNSFLCHLFGSCSEAIGCLACLIYFAFLSNSLHFGFHGSNSFLLLWPAVYYMLFIALLKETIEHMWSKAWFINCGLFMSMLSLSHVNRQQLIIDNIYKIVVYSKFKQLFYNHEYACLAGPKVKHVKLSMWNGAHRLESFHSNDDLDDCTIVTHIKFIIGKVPLKTDS